MKSQHQLPNQHSSAMQQNQTTQLPVLLLILALISSALLVLVGGGLFFFPDFSGARWLWPLTPFNLRFLGAIYLTALVALLSLALARRAVLMRLIVPMIWVFTTIVLLVSCLHSEQFEAGRRVTDIWFWLYLIDCVGASYYLGYLRQRSVNGLRRLPRAWSVGLGVQAGFLGTYGLSLFVFPEATGRYWSWPLDGFHAQLYSAIFLTGAMGSFLLARKARAIECRTLGLVQVTFSVLVLLSVWIVDSVVKKFDWSSGTNWVWLGVMATFGVIGLGLIYQSRSNFWELGETQKCP